MTIVKQTILPTITANADPTTGDDIADGWQVGQFWFNTVNKKLYKADSVAAGAAVWTEVGSGGGGGSGVDTLDNVGTGKAVGRDIVGTTLNLKTLVAGSNVTIDDSDPDELEISATGGGGGGSGVVVQSIETTDVTHPSTTSGAIADSGIKATITPTNASNRIKVTFVFACSAAGLASVGFTIKRDNTTDLTPASSDAIVGVAVPATDYQQCVVVT